jgi:hypothetical protein
MSLLTRTNTCSFLTLAAYRGKRWRNRIYAKYPRCMLEVEKRTCWLSTSFKGIKMSLTHNCLFNYEHHSGVIAGWEGLGPSFESPTKSLSHHRFLDDAYPSSYQVPGILLRSVASCLTPIHWTSERPLHLVDSFVAIH